ncbi:HEPN domain-containing protein [Burkholderia pseudomallei]|uniref:HEPN domain-containing protein n=1 Tax=Burkholderia pseudomallei TaxID=28450 RepID=UPI002DBDC410|nr:HEPN domain-containing protein [Burkholderia pseudomallei]MEB5487872.1 HEPN domain-containing protein [Burkholderia pseudomallei]MEB5494405.1 HEPN domain-containing protein [Burkholderia pseudomallei]MEB5500931.1 HEPN domain-containing protein [Burkholderia pseudomallei]MEB5506601.1 HEPN domain-containing protein [Burkholderia pseudomallei]MEB5513847.1 HEPN domain-containing protein [Burkholderia pseudomallei]
MDATFSRAPDPNADPEFQADFAKYLCVLVSGYLESALCALLLGFAQTRSSGDVASFVERQLGPWTNPKAEKIIDLFGSFNQDWRNNLTAYLVDQRKDSVNSLVALRHKIAHGESVGTSLSQIRSHYRIANEVIDHVADLVDPQA